MHTHAYTHIHTQTHSYIHTSTHTQIDRHAHTDRHTHTHTRTHARTHTHTHTHNTHTHTHTHYIYIGILFDNQLKFHSYTTEVAAKANHLLGLMRRSFNHLDLDMLTKLFVTSKLEYCNSIWGPSFALDQRKIERVQHRATRLLLPKLYGERFLILHAVSIFIAYRRLRGDMILITILIQVFLCYMHACLLKYYQY